MSLVDAKQRILAICRVTAAIEGVNADGSVHFTYHLDATPYFMLRTGPATHGYSQTQQLRTIEREIIIRLVVDHISAGYRGERECVVDTLLAPLIAAFDTEDGRLLVSEFYPTRPDYLDTLGVETLRDTGLNLLDTQGIGEIQIGTELTLLVPFLQDRGV